MIIREFKTANFTVRVEALPEDDLDLSWDESGEVRAKLESGEFVAFCAKASVIFRDHYELATDYLGQCIYDDPANFQDHRECAAETRRLRAEFGRDNIVCGSYFSDMVSEVIRQAREEFQTIKKGALRRPA